MPNAEVPIRPRPRWRRGGFSFTEILFAVMILGIGFIMVAAMFPVAIRQTEAGSQETIAAAIGRSSSNFMQQLAGMPLPAVQSIKGVGPVPTRQAPSILMPTFPQATLLAMQTNTGGYVLPLGQNSMVLPGQVWTMCDTRDPYFYTYQVTTTFPAAHNLLLWQSVGKNMIDPSDPRFAWVMMYRRDLIVQGQGGSPASSYTPAPFAQIICIGVQCRNTQIYDPNRDIPQNPITPAPPQPPATPSSLLPNLVGDCANNQGVTFVMPGSGVSYIDFSLAAAATPRPVPAEFAEGAYVVVCDDNVPPTAKVTTNNGYQNQYLHGALNGRIFRLGTAPTGGAWPLLPGSDLTAGDIALINAMSTLQPKLQFNVLVVGRGLDPGGSGAFIGPAQDVTAYTTFVPIAN